MLGAGINGEGMACGGGRTGGGMQYRGKKVEEAEGYLRAYIKDNLLQPGDKLPTESEAVRATGYSRVTVRRAYGNLLEQGLLSSVQGGGYYVNKGAEEKARHFIPFILSNDDASIAKSLDISQGAQSYLSSVDYRLAIAVTSSNGEHERQIIDEFYEQGARCLILWPYPGTENTDFYFERMQRGMSFVFVDIKPDISCNFIESDNFYGGYLAAEHLIKMGHTRISAYYHAPIDEVSSLSRRYAGFRYAKHRYGLTAGEGDLIIAEGEASLWKQLSGEGAPTAVFALNDGAAVALSDLVQRGRERLPGGLAVIGFDNSETAARHTPGISTIAQPFYQMGFEAARMAYEIALSGQGAFRNYTLPVELIVRDSTDPDRIARTGKTKG